MIILVILAGALAGIQNALAGGGSFITLPALIFAGLSPLQANITSTVALFPGQVATGLANRVLVSGTPQLSFPALLVLSLIGGALGGLLLLYTPESIFARLVPWLVLFATLVFAWGSFFRKPATAGAHLNRAGTGVAQFFIAVYGGYFGGGIGFLMLAALSFAGMQTRAGAATKNVLAAVMNASAVLIFAFSGAVNWTEAAALGIGAVGGGLIGARMLSSFPENILRIIVVAVGTALTVGLFLRPVH
ncbi:MAG: sulfite exporter TauE/SafE family protein [Xanthobacteraceae bacterium]